MADKIYNVLFVCTGNSARSIIAEALMNDAGARALQGVLGRQPSDGGRQSRSRSRRSPSCASRRRLSQQELGRVRRAGCAADRLRLHGLRQAAGEACPFWPGQPMTAHWGVPDPAAVEGTDEEKRLQFRDAAVTLKRRIDLMLSLPIESLDSMALQHELQDIGER